MIKELDDDSQDEESLKSRLDRYSKLTIEEKELKKEIKKDSADLHIKTKDTIEALSDDEAIILLTHKWIDPLVESVYKLPEEIINHLVSKVKDLKEKYNITFSEITEDIKDNQKTLLSLLEIGRASCRERV